jgi:hypothetical protein
MNPIIINAIGQPKINEIIIAVLKLIRCIRINPIRIPVAPCTAAVYFKVSLFNKYFRIPRTHVNSIWFGSRCEENSRVSIIKVKWNY